MPIWRTAQPLRAGGDLKPARRLRSLKATICLCPRETVFELASGARWDWPGKWLNWSRARQKSCYVAISASIDTSLLRIARVSSSPRLLQRNWVRRLRKISQKGQAGPRHCAVNLWERMMTKRRLLQRGTSGRSSLPFKPRDESAKRLTPRCLSALLRYLKKTAIAVEAQHHETKRQPRKT
jgi:hypothetical protein